MLLVFLIFIYCILYFTVCISYWCNEHYYALLSTGQLLVHPVALLSFFILSVFVLFCLISLHYVNGINKVMMMMMKILKLCLNLQPLSNHLHETDGLFSRKCSPFIYIVAYNANKQAFQRKWSGGDCSCLLYSVPINRYN